MIQNTWSYIAYIFGKTDNNIGNRPRFDGCDISGNFESIMSLAYNTLGKLTYNYVVYNGQSFLLY